MVKVNDDVASLVAPMYNSTSIRSISGSCAGVLILEIAKQFPIAHKGVQTKLLPNPDEEHLASHVQVTAPAEDDEYDGHVAQALVAKL